jgi:hypothetical protein
MPGQDSNLSLSKQTPTDAPLPRLRAVLEQTASGNNKKKDIEGKKP